jgi:hypothetical protein
MYNTVKYPKNIGILYLFTPNKHSPQATSIASLTLGEIHLWQ